jgi:hypothetical protein
MDDITHVLFETFNRAQLCTASHLILFYLRIAIFVNRSTPLTDSWRLFSILCPTELNKYVCNKR